MNMRSNGGRKVLMILALVSVAVLNTISPSTKALASSPASMACLSIWDKYWEQGGVNGFLGAPTTAETIAPDGVGHYRYFENGSIYWSPRTCAHTVYGAIWAKWASMGWERSYLGYPVTDESDAPGGGRYNDFEGGSIYASDAGIHEVHGAIRNEWAEMGGSGGFLGHPVTDETVTPDGIGRFNYFEGGAIYWTPQTGAHEVHGAILDKWANLGWEQPQGLGYPVTDESNAGSDVHYSTFTRGSIYFINQPNVGQKTTPYEQIPLRLGDRVTVDAGGCVQTGGAGDTWKRYVDPQADDGDLLYHGLIEIWPTKALDNFPTSRTVPGMVRIQDIIGRELTVSADGTPLHGIILALGYEDDDYSDNGYWGHDDGTGGQCRDIGPAWVRIAIKH